MAELLTRDQILAADDLPRELVEVPEWGGAVLVRTLTGAERDQFEAQVVEMRGRKIKSLNMANLRARLVSLCVVDEKGERLFTDADVKALGGKSAAALQRVFDVASRLSGLGEEDIEELEKNLDAGRNGDSGSD